MAVVEVTEAAARSAAVNRPREVVEHTGVGVAQDAIKGAAVDHRDVERETHDETFLDESVEHDETFLDLDFPVTCKKRAQRPVDGFRFQSCSSSASTDVPFEVIEIPLIRKKRTQGPVDRSKFLSCPGSIDADKGVGAMKSWPIQKISGLQLRRNCNLALLQRATSEATCHDCLAASGYIAGCVIGRSMSNHGFSVISVTKGGHAFAAKVTSEHVDEGILRDTLKREHGILSRLDHHRIVHAVALVEATGGCGMVMERCGGVPLMSLLPADSALCCKGRHAVVECILDAVSYLHGQHVAHTDLHAGNVMVHCPAVPPTGGPAAAPGVKIIDFGSARDVAAEGGGDLADGLGGDISPGIKPPECAQGVLNPLACDVFEVGLLAAGLVAGRSLTTRAVVKKGAPAIPEGFLRLSAAGQAHTVAMLNPLPEERPEARACLASLPPGLDWAAEA